MTVMTRKRFVAVGAGAVPAALLLGMFGCGDDEDDDDDGATPTTGGADGTTGPGMTTAPATTTDGATTAAETTGGAGTTTGGADGTTEAPDDTTGADGTTAATGTTGAAVCESVESEVGPADEGPPHDHMLTVPAKDVAAGREVTYMTTLEAGHFHEVTVTADMFASLATGETVMVDTVPDATGHMHPITLACE